MDNLRQGVSSGFNFKDILNNDAPCSEDGMSELKSGRQDNPLDNVEEAIQTGYLKKEWMSGGHGN